MPTTTGADPGGRSVSAPPRVAATLEWTNRSGCPAKVSSTKATSQGAPGVQARSPSAARQLGRPLPPTGRTSICSGMPSRSGIAAPRTAAAQAPSAPRHGPAGWSTGRQPIRGWDHQRIRRRDTAGRLDCRPLAVSLARLSRTSQNMRWRSPPDACPVVASWGVIERTTR